MTAVYLADPAPNLRHSPKLGRRARGPSGWLSILKGETSVAQAARKHGLTVAEIEDWQERFLLAAENGLRARPKDEKALKDEHIKKLKQKIGELAVNPHARAHAAARRSVRVAIWRSTSRRPHVTAICWTSRQRCALPHRLELVHRVGRSQQPRVGALVREGARDVRGLAAVPVHGDQLQRFQELARDRWGGGGPPAAISRATEHLSPPRRRDAFVVRRSLVSPRLFGGLGVVLRLHS
jgi:hypothetical protein